MAKEKGTIRYMTTFTGGLYFPDYQGQIDKRLPWSNSGIPMNILFILFHWVNEDVS